MVGVRICTSSKITIITSQEFLFNPFVNFLFPKKIMFRVIVTGRHRGSRSTIPKFQNPSQVELTLEQDNDGTVTYHVA